jgi:hypothetical protein
MTDFLAWVSFLLDVYNTWPIWSGKRRRVRRSEGCVEWSLFGVYRRRVKWTETDAPR